MSTMSTVKDVVSVLDQFAKENEFTWSDLFLAAGESAAGFNPFLWAYQGLFVKFCPEISAGNDRPLTSMEEKLLERAVTFLKPEKPIPERKTAA